MRTNTLILLAGVLTGCMTPPTDVASSEQALPICYPDCYPEPSTPPPVTVCTSCATAPHAIPVASCSLFCTAGWGDCNHVYSDGCEAVLNSVNNCGVCGRVCSGANGVAACSSGVCNIACNSGFANCDGAASNGCETNLLTSVNNCGSCGHACDSGATCMSGVCSTTTVECGDGVCSPGESCSYDCGCPSGYVDCCGDGSCLPSTICWKICP